MSLSREKIGLYKNYDAQETSDGNRSGTSPRSRCRSGFQDAAPNVGGFAEREILRHASVIDVALDLSGRTSSRRMLGKRILAEFRHAKRSRHGRPRRRIWPRRELRQRNPR
jgi:hypothetical protein